MNRRGDLAEVKQLLQAQIMGLVKHLLPEGHRSGNYWMAKNPTRHDRCAGSFWVSVAGGAAGAWKDEATGDKGDVIKLIEYIHGSDIKEALKWARGWLGLADMPEARRRELSVQAKARQELEAKREAQRLIDNRRRALGVWAYECAKSLLGTVAETYLAGRGIRLAELERQPGALRFSPAQKHPESGRSWPAIVAAMVGADNQVVAIHRTFLAADGSGKAPVEPQRKIWPRYKGTGACIHLWRGETGLSHIEAEKRGLWDTLLICEGLETGLSFAVACPELRVWAAGTLGNIADVRLPACAREVIVAGENDWDNPQAKRLLDAALMNLARQGRRQIKLARSRIGSDANDALKAELSWRGTC
jgi:hypothetical protein